MYKERNRARCPGGALLRAASHRPVAWVAGEPPGAEGRIEGRAEQHGAKGTTEGVGTTYIPGGYGLLDVQENGEKEFFRL